MSESNQIGRLAMRQEGAFWNAYYAPETGSMKGATMLGSIQMNAIADDPKRKAAFMEMMREVVADVVEKATGIRPIWGGPQTAPEHERAGNA